jgi:hypothetical protein
MTAAYVLACPACRLPGGPFGSLAEAEHLAGTHDHLLHRGQPTTVVSPRPPAGGGQLVADRRDLATPRREAAA